MLADELIQCFKDPQQFVSKAHAADWSHLLQQGRQYGTTAQLYALFNRQQLLDSLPDKVLQHLEWGWRYYQRQRDSLYFELLQLETHFAQLNYPVLLLKGAAYQAVALTASEGRLYADIDILVPRAALDDCKARLFFAGFLEGPVSDYDKYYYLELTHENPPLYHISRGSSIDLHFNIYPVASRKNIDINYFIEQAQPLSGSVFSVPSQLHLFVHAAVHFFWQEEHHKILKDLIDLDLLFADIARKNLQSELITQSRLLGAEQAVINVIQLLAEIFGREFTQSFTADIANSEQQRPFARLLVLSMLNNTATAGLAKLCWLVRGYLHKFHMKALLRHIGVKTALCIRSWFTPAGGNSDTP
ncbi:nucleotidyltransferase family protein [Arsukibacterium sp.]|uniref:nucleotidyltransferase family protein n=1 Tax=Arsukibacterium sp. TaxID=1977258 RepID=UPI002FD89CB8